MAALKQTIPTNESERWISLGAACKLLGVNETTLRHWADDGKVRTFRTMGGHRRFSRHDVYALISQADAGIKRPAQEWGPSALRRIRRKLHVENGHSQEWMDRFDAEGKDRMRFLGRRLLSLAVEYMKDKRNRADHLEEARFIGEQYGQEMARHGIPLKQAVQAFLFFRNSITDAAKESIKAMSPNADAAIEASKDITALSDQVLLHITDAYTKTPQG